MYSLATGGSRFKYESDVTQDISIHRHFSPTWLEIRYYLEKRSRSYLFVNAAGGREHLWGLIRKCIASRTTRCLKSSAQHTNSEPELEYVTVTGMHGLKLRISDVHASLGLLITETDPLPVVNGESQNDVKEKHLKMLATYTKWIDIAQAWFTGDPSDVAPSTACLMYTKTTTRVPEIVLTTGGIQRPAYSYVPIAVFPNLSAHLKSAALKLQQENLQGFKDGLAFAGLSPQELAGYDVLFGHCAELLALLYMLDPDSESRVYLNGVTTQVAPIRGMSVYRADLFKSKLKLACANCQYVIRSINDAMGKIREGGIHAFQYSDKASEYSSTRRATSVPHTVTCARDKCKAQSSPSNECPNCRMLWYCSPACRQNDAPSHAFSCAGQRKCPVCGRAGSRTCNKCPPIHGRVPTRFCDDYHLVKYHETQTCVGKK
ncbi:hypothetical protein C8R43DRAFT_257579 [Mycena crocata]|nr:hypothetical protein C8R43DRAFT_257579 [Mycena crocata]